MNAYDKGLCNIPSPASWLSKTKSSPAVSSATAAEAAWEFASEAIWEFGATAPAELAVVTADCIEALVAVFLALLSGHIVMLVFEEYVHVAVGEDWLVYED